MNRPLSLTLFSWLLLVSTSVADEASLRKAVTFYASFDESLQADVAGGQRTPDTRFNHETAKGQFVVEKGFEAKVFTISKGQGIVGGALNVVDVLPRNGRIFYPLQGNWSFDPKGWSGSVSMWCKTDPDRRLKTKFCDPVQITQNGSGNGGLWFDFNDATPRALRHGAFPMIRAGAKGIGEDDPNAPMVRVPKIGWKDDTWHHVVMTFKNLDTGKADAHTALYIDGKLIGEVKGRDIAMGWDVAHAGIYTAINYIGLLDEMALFNTALTPEDVSLLYKQPALLASLKKKTAPPPPAFPFTAKQAQDYQRAYAAWAKLPVEFTNTLGMTFVLIPPGQFTMGSPDTEAGRNPGDYDEGPLHQVTLTEAFYLGKHEVTNAQFARFVAAGQYMTDTERNGGGHVHNDKAAWTHHPGTHWRKIGYAGPFQTRSDHPVVHVSHNDAQAFCRWLTKQPRLLDEPHGTFALPSEDQWEWACRSGSDTAYWWGNAEDTTGRVANVGDQALKSMHPAWPRAIMPMNDGHAFIAPVGSYQANGFGLHDMLGNVWEFCRTRYGPYPKEAVVDPVSGDPKRGFAVRGGGWSNAPRDCRSAVRNADPPTFGHSNLGFRVAIPIGLHQGLTATEVLNGLQDFYRKTARADGSFQPGIDPNYRGMSDAAYSDLAAVTYAVTVAKTFGWQLPHEEKTITFLRNRQKPNGDFFNVAGTVAPESPEGRTYNTTQGLVALHALGQKPRYNPLPTFEAILKEDYKQLPAYSTSFFPLAYLCAGQPIPAKADRGIRALMVQDETGYANDHVAATFHASHYYRLVGEETPRAKEMVARILRDQKPDGSWFRNMPARDRHATFDAVFTLLHEGGEAPECRAAIQRAAAWSLACRNPDGGFGHYPGSTSDADAIYFHMGTLVMAGVLRPVSPLPAKPELLSWGHLMPVVKTRERAPLATYNLPAWVAGVAYRPNGEQLAVARADHMACLFDTTTRREVQVFKGHSNALTAIQFHPSGKQLATASYDHEAALWDATTGKQLHCLTGHRGAVLTLAYNPDQATLATASMDQTIKIWDIATGQCKDTLKGHQSWISALAYHPKGTWLASVSSDGTLRIWYPNEDKPRRTIDVTNAEIRSLAVAPDGKHLAVVLRYGTVKLFTTNDWQEQRSIPGSGDMCCVAFSPNGAHIATSEGDWNRGGIVHIREIATGRSIVSYNHTGEVLSLSFSPDGSTIAAGAADKTVRVWKCPPRTESPQAIPRQ